MQTTVTRGTPKYGVNSENMIKDILWFKALQGLSNRCKAPHVLSFPSPNKRLVVLATDHANYFSANLLWGHLSVHSCNASSTVQKTIRFYFFFFPVVDMGISLYCLWTLVGEEGKERESGQNKLEPGTTLGGPMCLYAVDAILSPKQVLKFYIKRKVRKINLQSLK